MKKFWKFFKSINFFIKFLFFLSILFIITGITLIVFSYKYEILDEKYLIVEHGEYRNKESNSLSNGEVKVTGNTKYIKDGIFKVTFNSHASKNNGKKVLDDDSNLVITDNLGEGYELYQKEIVINEKEYNYSENIISKDNIKFSLREDEVSIQVPAKLVNKNNTITFYIRLSSRNLNKIYETTKDSYYSFTPSSENTFYEKTGSQSYIINGSGYIKLANK